VKSEKGAKSEKEAKIKPARDKGGPPQKKRWERMVAPSIGDLLEKSIGTGFLHFTYQNPRIYEIFERAAGPEVLKRVSPYGYQLGVLYLRTDSPHYLERCRYLSKQWIKDMNIELGCEFLTDIRIKVLPEGAPSETLPDPELGSVSEEAMLCGDGMFKG
jgi:hypothetical protein